MRSKWLYYLGSILTILRGVKSRASAVRLFMGLPIQRPLIIELNNGCRFKVRSAMDVWIIKETCLDRDYERNCTDIEDDWVVIDIGAGLGDFAIGVAREHPTTQVYAYEPFLDSFELLQENVALNQVTNVHVFPYAIGARSGMMNLEMTTGIAVQHSTAKIITAPTAGATVQVNGISLDDVFEKQALSHCDFLKVDCEGGEYDIFFHASKGTLSKISHICLEYHNNVTRFAHKDLVAFFEGNGFSVEIHPNPVHDHLGLLYAFDLRQITRA